MAAASRPASLQQAASAVFAVTTVVPLLVFVWTLYRIGGLSHIQSQVGLGLALGIALLGFYIFRRLMGQMSLLIHGLGRVVQGMRPANDSSGSSVAHAHAAGLITEYKPPVRDDEQTHPAAAADVAAPAVTLTPIAVAGATPRPASRSVEPAQSAHRSAPIPGLGMIQEVDDLSHAMAKLWMAEALSYKGRRVALSIMNARAPITGTLVDVTHDELLIDQDGGTRVAVSYGRLAGIDPA